MKFLFSILILCTAAFYCPAQVSKTSLPVEISISVKKTKDLFFDKAIPVTLKVTNNSLPPVNTEQFDRIAIYLSKTLDLKTVEKTETAYLKLKPKILKTGESVEIQIDLNELSWADESSEFSDPGVENGFKPLRWGQYFLSAAVGNCDRVMPENSLLTVVRRPCTSNSILMDFQAASSNDSSSSVPRALEKNIKIEIALKIPKILLTAENVPAKVKITNKSAQILDTTELNRLVLYLSKGRQNDQSVWYSGLLYGAVELESKKMKAGQSFEFFINLSEVKWNYNNSSNDIAVKNFGMVPAENFYFYAAMPTRKNALPDGARLPEDFLSNEIPVTFYSK